MVYREMTRPSTGPPEGSGSQQPPLPRKKEVTFRTPLVDESDAQQQQAAPLWLHGMVDHKTGKLLDVTRKGLWVLIRFDSCEEEVEEEPCLTKMVEQYDLHWNKEDPVWHTITRNEGASHGVFAVPQGVWVVKEVWEELKPRVEHWFPQCTSQQEKALVWSVLAFTHGMVPTTSPPPSPSTVPFAPSSEILDLIAASDTSWGLYGPTSLGQRKSIEEWWRSASK